MHQTIKAILPFYIFILNLSTFCSDVGALKKKFSALTLEQKTELINNIHPTVRKYHEGNYCSAVSYFFCNFKDVDPIVQVKKQIGSMKFYNNKSVDPDTAFRVWAMGERGLVPHSTLKELDDATNLPLTYRASRVVITTTGNAIATTASAVYNTGVTIGTVAEPTLRVIEAAKKAGIATEQLNQSRRRLTGRR